MIINNDADDAKSMTDQLFGDFLFNRVLDSFQVQKTVEARRTAARLVDMRRSTVADLNRFMELYELRWMIERCALVVAESPDTNALDVVLCFSAQLVTPFELFSSVRAQVPTARDGVDFLIVWAPQPYSIPNRAPIRESCIDVYLTMTQSVWRAIALGSLPRLVVETAAHAVTIINATRRSWRRCSMRLCAIIIPILSPTHWRQLKRSRQQHGLLCRSIGTSIRRKRVTTPKARRELSPTSLQHWQSKSAAMVRRLRDNRVLAAVRLIRVSASKSTWRRVLSMR